MIAIPLNDGLKERIGAVQGEFRKQQVRGNYAPAEDLHITLASIGESIAPARVLDVMCSVRFRPFEITMDRLGQSEGLWWIGLSKNAELDMFAHGLRDALAENGIPFDHRRIRPHITILRKPEHARGQFRPIGFDPVSMPVERVALMLSARGKNGTVFTELGYVRRLEK